MPKVHGARSVRTGDRDKDPTANSWDSFSPPQPCQRRAWTEFDEWSCKTKRFPSNRLWFHKRPRVCCALRVLQPNRRRACERKRSKEANGSKRNNKVEGVRPHTRSLHSSDSWGSHHWVYWVYTKYDNKNTQDKIRQGNKTQRHIKREDKTTTTTTTTQN